MTQWLDGGSGLADPWRLTLFWLQAEDDCRARIAAADKRWRMAVDQELAEAGVFKRVAAANSAIASQAFQEGFVARQEERAAAQSENDLAAIARAVLEQLGVDLTDIHIRLRRAMDTEMTRMMRREGWAQVKLRATPTVDAARRALDAAAAKGYPVPGASAGGASGGLQHSGQGTMGV